MRILCSAVAAAAAAAATLDLTLFDTARFPQALCNDGSPAGYYFQKSTTNSDLWIVHQQGGGWCYDEDSCKARDTDLTSSTNWSFTLDVGGLFSPTDSRLQSANFVYLRYCSSDAWTGNSVSDFGFRFYGYQIVQAAFATLARDHGMGSSGAASVLYSGCSAGARGVLFNLEATGAYLQGLLGPKLARFGGLLDSAFWMDITPLDPNVVSLTYQVQVNINLFNASGHLNPACMAAYTPSGSQWKCMMGQYAVAFASEPYLLHAFQYDAYQLGVDEAVGVPSTPQQLAYAEFFRNATRQGASNDTIVPAKAGTAALLPACFKHCNTETSTFSTIITNGASLEDATCAWFFGLPARSSHRLISGGSAKPEGITVTPRSSTGVAQYIVENCSGFNCGNDCPPA